ncbi:MAG: ABC transporter permease [Bifidobacteriaceae bacterium]|jgi:peptide/nickel transport system permease protein|nr:ABC transporter permease [Bifidobacteriaceae bacterium]
MTVLSDAKPAATPNLTKLRVKGFFSRVPVIIGSVIILTVVVFAVAAPLIAPYDPAKQDVVARLQPMSAEHWFGTDGLGRDVLSRLIFGSRTSLLVGLFSTLVAGCFGMAIGLIAGFVGKWVDSIMMRVMDALMSIPIIILALFLGAVLGRGLGNIILCLGIVMTPSYARVTRGQVLSVKQLDYVTAARVSGGTGLKTVVHHIFPNCLAPNMVLATMNLGVAILVEAALSFLGMGIAEPTPSWGGMVSQGKDVLTTAPTMAVAASLFIVITVWAFNVVGDAVRDLLDPRLRGAL